MKRLSGVLLLVGLWGVARCASAQVIVEDPLNLVQNTVQAVQAVLTVANQVLELTGLDEIVLGDDLGADLGQLQELGQDAQGLQADLANIQLQITLLFDLQTAPNSSTALQARLAAIRQLTWKAYVDALRTESLLQSSVSALRHMVRIIEGLGAFLGNQQGNQTLAQMDAKLTVELIKLRTQTAAFHRARALDRLEEPLTIEALGNIFDAIMEDHP